MQYHGTLEMNERVLAAMAKGEPLDYGDTYFMTSPRFETGDERYAWVNHVIAVAEGRVLPNARIGEISGFRCPRKCSSDNSGGDSGSKDSKDP